jgi:hypothetical protein
MSVLLTDFETARVKDRKCDKATASRRQDRGTPAFMPPLDDDKNYVQAAKDVSNVQDRMYTVRACWSAVGCTFAQVDTTMSPLRDSQFLP